MKLADFGSCRGIYTKQPFTEYISTRWYRAPECLLTDGYYNYKMDIWGIGCVFFEVMSLFPLFPGNNELDQVHKIHNILGTPPRDILDYFKKYASHMDFNFPQKEGTGIIQLIPHVTKECQQLIIKLLSYNPDERPTAKQALNNPYFHDLREQDKKVQQMSSLNPGVAAPSEENFEEDNSIKNTNRNMGLTMQVIANNSMGMKKTKLPSKISKGKNELPVIQHEKHNISSENEEHNNSNSNLNTNQLPPINRQGIKKKTAILNDFKNLVKQTSSNKIAQNGKKVILNRSLQARKLTIIKRIMSHHIHLKQCKNYKNFTVKYFIFKNKSKIKIDKYLFNIYK